MNADVNKILKERVVPAAWYWTKLIVIVVLLYNFVLFFVIVPTGSMIPTILEHSVLFATRVHNVEKDLKRGDIVVFMSEELGDILLVKRLIGLPGEKIVIDDKGQVSIDGQPLEESYVKHYSAKSGEFEVPDDCYFFMGDNRSGSLDARSWENPYIPEDKIKGKVHFTIWPVSKFGILK